MIGLATVVALPLVWRLIKDALGVMAPRPPKIVLPDRKDKEIDIETCDGLVDIVECWEHLTNSCEAHGMVQATAALRKIFPLFVIVEDADEEAE
tara:strand:- start:372 stop:653 length:282 start_codon:yes stop_codon:yes gene_type:complete